MTFDHGAGPRVYDLYMTANRIEYLQSHHRYYDQWAVNTCQAMIQDFRYNTMVDTTQIMPELNKNEAGYLDCSFWFQKYGVLADMSAIARAQQEETEFADAIDAMMNIWEMEIQDDFDVSSVESNEALAGDQFADAEE